MENKTKCCTLCNIDKDIIEFIKDKGSKDGHTTRCNVCRRAYQKQWRNNNPDKVKALNERKKPKRDLYYNDPENKLKYRKKFIEKSFGIDYSVYEQLQEEQNNLCAICNKPQISTRLNYLCVDHNHVTGKVRGLLCSSCNRGIGLLNDDINILERAVEYLKTTNDISNHTK